MWKKAVEREKKSKEFERIAERIIEVSGDGVGKEEEIVSQEELEKKSNEFRKILEVPGKERDRIQRMQVVDRAAAAIAAAKEILQEDLLRKEASGDLNDGDGGGGLEGQGVKHISVRSEGGSASTGTPGPSFWSWTPPPDSENSSSDGIIMKPSPKTSQDPAHLPVMEKERSLEFLQIPFESAFLKGKTLLPPVQPLGEEGELEVTSSTQETHNLEEEREFGVVFSAHAAEAAEALQNVNDVSSQGIDANGARWWIQTGLEKRPDGVVCKWTLHRGVSADKAIEWEEKYWEAADELGYKELGSEKSGRDAAGNIWREYWRESMLQNGGLAEMEKTADKWAKNAKGEEWQEQWWEHYGASGQAEKWAHKWCSLDPSKQLDVGHAHVWHERWGEKYDGKGGSTKYTDKWAERFEDGGWSKWGDKWDENFDLNSHGVKQGETWWEGKNGERWNRTWGEGHNGSGWVHKYGKSSSGEHWDTHVMQDTWYERFPHYGFYHCFENSVKLREVKRPSEWS